MIIPKTPSENAEFLFLDSSYLLEYTIGNMYIKKTTATLADGTKAKYLHLAQNYWDSEAQTSKTKIIHSFGREDKLDKEVLERLVASINRYLHPGEEDFDFKKLAEQGGSSEFDFIWAKKLGGPWFLNELWQKLDFDSIIKKLVSDRNYEIDIERLIFTMVANRALNPSSKLAIEDWVEDEVYIPGVKSVKSQNLYRAMDFLLECQKELEYKVFDSVAHMFNLEIDLLYFDTTSSYFEVDPREVPENDDFRKLGYSKDKRPGQVQIVIGLAVTRSGIPIKSWVWPGNTQDMSVIEEVKDDLVGWKLGRVITVCDCGFGSDDNLRYLQRTGGHYIAGEKLRSKKKEVKEAMARPGRYKDITEDLKVKEVTVGDGEARTRYVLVLNSEEAKKDKKQREEIISEIKDSLEHLRQLPEEQHTKKMCELRSHKVFGKYLRQLKDGRLKLDKGQIREEEKYDGKYILKTSDDTLSVRDIVLGYRQLFQIEDAFRTIKSELDLRPNYHRLEKRIRSHVLLVWLALLLIRIAENETDMTWNRILKELNKLKIGKFIFNSSGVFQRTKVEKEQREIFDILGIKLPPKYPKVEADL